MKGKTVVGILCCLLFFAVYIAPVSAPLSTYQDFSLSKGGVVVAEDGWLSAGTFWGTLVISIPSGSIRQHAYLYMSFWNLDPGERSVEFAGNLLGDPYNAPYKATDPAFGEASTVRYDVTSYVPPTGSGSYGITVTALGAPSWGFYGAALVVIYDNDPNGTPARIIIKDGIECCRGDILQQNYGVLYYRVQFQGISTPVSYAKLWAMGQGGTSAYPGEEDELWVNGNLIDTNAFRESGGQGWDCRSWPLSISIIQSTTNVDFYDKNLNDGYYLDFAILELKYPAPPPELPEFSSLPEATLLALTLLISFLAVQKRFGKRKK